jgi:hypothetical protein
MKSKLPVVFENQVWRDFKIPPEGDGGGYGPSSCHLWVYYPEDNYVTQWHNWSGCSRDIKELIKEKAMWCYCLEPIMPRKTK